MVFSSLVFLMLQNIDSVIITHLW